MKRIFSSLIILFLCIDASQPPLLEKEKLPYEIPHTRTSQLLQTLPQDVWVEVIFSHLKPKEIKKAEDVKDIKKLKLVSKFFYSLCDSDATHRFISPDFVTSTLLLNTKNKRKEFDLYMFKLNAAEREQDLFWIFQTAVLYEAIPIIKKTIDQGIDPNKSNGRRFRPPALCHAANTNTLPSVSVLLDHPKTDPNVLDDFNKTSLMIAARRNHTDVLQLLLEHPLTNPDITKPDGQNALAIALSNHNQEAARILMPEQADLDENAESENQQENNSCLCIPIHCIIS